MNKAVGFEKAWDFVWKYLYYAPTKLIYDGRASDNAETGMIEDLPTPEEISLEIPNVCGWGSGMEDSVLNNGSMLEAVINRYNVTKEEKMKDIAKDLFSGLRTCAEVAGSKGYIARSVSPVDNKTHFPNSSRDQYTHWIYASRLYYHSDFSDEEERTFIKKIFTDIAERAEENVIEENGFDLLDEKGRRGLVTEMWGELAAHEAMRLPMIYAVAWDVTGNIHWKDMYMKYRDEAYEKSLRFAPEYGLAYTLLQMQYSLRLVYEVENDDVFKAKLTALMEHVADLAAVHTVKTANMLNDETAALFCEKLPPLRERTFTYQKIRGTNRGYFFARYDSFYKKCFIPIRNSGEAIIVQTLCPGRKISDEDIDALCKVADFVDYEHNYFYAPLLIAASYWALRALGY